MPEDKYFCCPLRLSEAVQLPWHHPERCEKVFPTMVTLGCGKAGTGMELTLRPDNMTASRLPAHGVFEILNTVWVSRKYTGM